MKESVILAEVRRHRTEKGISQQQLAEKIGISQQAYMKVENGRTKLTVPVLLKIADVLEMDLAELFRPETKEVALIPADFAQLAKMLADDKSRTDDRLKRIESMLADVLKRL